MLSSNLASDFDLKPPGYVYPPPHLTRTALLSFRRQASHLHSTHLLTFTHLILLQLLPPWTLLKPSKMVKNSIQDAYLLASLF